MAEQNEMDMGWSGAGWMDPAPMPSTPEPAPAPAWAPSSEPATPEKTAVAKVNALVCIGDAMEEQIDDLAEKAGHLGLHGVPVFIFQEGRSATAETAFREIARLSKGAWFRFDRNSASTLARLLSAVAVFAAGGMRALEARGRPEDRLLLEHLKGGGRT